MQNLEADINTWHKKFAVDLFNHVWTLLTKENRSRKDDEDMLHAAHASRHHWSIVGDARNIAIGEWQLSRVYAVIGRAEPAIYHGQRSLDVCLDAKLSAFNVAYGHEALARAYSVAGNSVETQRNLLLAREASAGIKEKEEQDMLLQDLETIRIP